MARRRRDPFEVDTCPKCGRTVAIVRAPHNWSAIFTLRQWHLTPDRKNRCTNTHWSAGAAHV